MIILVRSDIFVHGKTDCMRLGLIQLVKDKDDSADDILEEHKASPYDRINVGWHYTSTIVDTDLEESARTKCKRILIGPVCVIPRGTIKLVDSVAYDSVTSGQLCDLSFSLVDNAVNKFYTMRTDTVGSARYEYLDMSDDELGIALTDIINEHNSYETVRLYGPSQLYAVVTGIIYSVDNSLVVDDIVGDLTQNIWAPHEGLPNYPLIRVLYSETTSKITIREINEPYHPETVKWMQQHAIRSVKSAMIAYEIRLFQFKEDNIIFLEREASILDTMKRHKIVVTDRLNDHLNIDLANIVLDYADFYKELKC